MWNVDYSTRHASNHDNATRGLPFNQVTGNASGKKIGTINVDSPAFLDTVMRVVDGIKILCEAGRGDKAVDAAMLSQDVINCLVDRVGAADISVVGSYFRRSAFISPA